jgi:hypothetical protein
MQRDDALHTALLLIIGNLEQNLPLPPDKTHSPTRPPQASTTSAQQDPLLTTPKVMCAGASHSFRDHPSLRGSREHKASHSRHTKALPWLKNSAHKNTCLPLNPYTTASQIPQIMLQQAVLAGLATQLLLLSKNAPHSTHRSPRQNPSAPDMPGMPSTQHTHTHTRQALTSSDKL